MNESILLPTLPKRKTFQGTIPSLDGFRALSIIIVVLSHVPASIGVMPPLARLLVWVVPSGEIGVRVFFVISGLLITFLLIKEREKYGTVNLRLFYIRRFLRIVPVFVVYLIVVAALNSLLDLGIPPGPFISSLLYINNFVPWGGHWLVGHSWSLSVEEQFYLLWPSLFRKIYHAHSWWMPVFVLILGSIMRSLHYKYPHLSEFVLAPFFMYADFMFAGACLAYLFYFHFDQVREKIEKVPAVLVYIAIVAIWLFSTAERKMPVVFVPIAGAVVNISICFPIVYFIFRKQSPGYTFLNTPAVIWVGRLSYSIYIWQELFLVPAHISYSRFWWNQFPQNILFSLLVAYLSFQLIEKPFLRIKDRYKKIKA